MKRKSLAIILVFALFISLFSCTKKQKTAINSVPNVSDTTFENSKYADMILTKEEMLEDYDTMWTTMEENYPFFGVIERRRLLNNSESYKDTIQRYRSQIEDMELQGDKAMWKFIEIIAESLYEVTDDPHVSIVNSDHWRSNLELYKNHIDLMRPWLEAIDKPEIASAYEYYDYLIALIYPNIDSSSVESKNISDDYEEELANMKASNLTTEILEEGKTAYIKIISFDDVFIEGDSPKIREFLEETETYDNLIIDIRDNGGGNAQYWIDAIVRPNIAEPLTETQVRIMGAGELAQRFYGDSYRSTDLTIDDIKNNPTFTSLKSEDLENMVFARKIIDTIQPESSEKKFDGKVWLLVNNNVYSTAEAFAVFCKSTGFSTLIGETTGGGNTGGPIPFELPNSHILVQFDVEYCLNPDGSCSQEIGTVPDIESEDALQTVLDLIK